LEADRRERLISKAVEFLQHRAADVTLPRPSEGELRHLMEMATGVVMTDQEFLARRDLPAFDEIPWNAEWTAGKPELPEGFLVAIIGSGFSGIAAGPPFQRVRAPYVILAALHAGRRAD